MHQTDAMFRCFTLRLGENNLFKQKSLTLCLVLSISGDIRHSFWTNHYHNNSEASQGWYRLFLLCVHLSGTTPVKIYVHTCSCKCLNSIKVIEIRSLLLTVILFNVIYKQIFVDNLVLSEYRNSLYVVRCTPLYKMEVSIGIDL
jgi:hypothetical protein